MFGMVSQTQRFWLAERNLAERSNKTIARGPEEE